MLLPDSKTAGRSQLEFGAEDSTFRGRLRSPDHLRGSVFVFLIQKLGFGFFASRTLTHSCSNYEVSLTSNSSGRSSSLFFCRAITKISNVVGRSQVQNTVIRIAINRLVA